MQERPRPVFPPNVTGYRCRRTRQADVREQTETSTDRRIAMPEGIIEWLDEHGNAKDIAHGLPVIVFARWILVVAGLVLTAWNPPSLAEFQVSIVLILGLAVGNFFLHAQLLRQRPVNAAVVYAASAADLIIVSTILIVSGNFPSTLVVFYLPALLAIAVTFSTRATLLYTVAVLATYGLVAVTKVGPELAGAVLTHVLILTAVPVCGNVYWRMERDRRMDSTEVREALSGSFADMT